MSSQTSAVLLDSVFHPRKQCNDLLQYKYPALWEVTHYMQDSVEKCIRIHVRTVIINDIHSSSISNELSTILHMLGEVRERGSKPQCHSVLILQRDHVIGSEELNKYFIV